MVDNDALSAEDTTDKKTNGTKNKRKRTKKPSFEKPAVSLENLYICRTKRGISRNNGFCF